MQLKCVFKNIKCFFFSFFLVISYFILSDISWRGVLLRLKSVRWDMCDCILLLCLCEAVFLPDVYRLNLSALCSLSAFTSPPSCKSYWAKSRNSHKFWQYFWKILRFFWIVEKPWVHFFYVSFYYLFIFLSQFHIYLHIFLFLSYMIWIVGVFPQRNISIYDKNKAQLRC